MENSRRGRNNQKWQGLEQKEKIDVKLVEAEERRKEIGRTQAFQKKRSVKTN